MWGHTPWSGCPVVPYETEAERWMMHRWTPNKWCMNQCITHIWVYFCLKKYITMVMWYACTYHTTHIKCYNMWHNTIQFGVWQYSPHNHWISLLCHGCNNLWPLNILNWNLLWFKKKSCIPHGQKAYLMHTKCYTIKHGITM